jgi:hypothetical protein
MHEVVAMHEQGAEWNAHMEIKRLAQAVAPKASNAVTASKRGL